MRRTVGILILISFSLSGLWGQLWHTLGLSPPRHRITPSCSGGSGDPDGGCPPPH